MNTKVVRIREEEKTREATGKKSGASGGGRDLKKRRPCGIYDRDCLRSRRECVNEEAAKKIYAAKGRPSDNPLIAHISCMEELPAIVKEIPEAGRKLAEKYWPGPLTADLSEKRHCALRNDRRS